MTQDHLNELLTVLQASPFEGQDVHDLEHQSTYDALAQWVEQREDTSTNRTAEHALLFHLYGQWRQRLDDNIALEDLQGMFEQARALGLSKKTSRFAVGFALQLRRTYNSILQNVQGNWLAITRLRHALWVAIFGANLRRYINALADVTQDISVIVHSESGIDTSALITVLSQSIYAPFDERLDGAQFAPQAVHLKLPEGGTMTQHSALFGHRKNTLPVGPKTHDGVFKQSHPNNHFILENMERATRETWRILSEALNTRQFTELGAEESQPWSGRLFIITQTLPSELIANDTISVEDAHTLFTYPIALPPLRAHLSQSPDARRWWLNHLHTRWLGSPMSEGAMDEVEAMFDDRLGPHYMWPGNDLEMLRALKHAALANRAPAPMQSMANPIASDLSMAMSRGKITVKDLTMQYCQMLYERLGTYEAVATQTGLDRRTVKKYCTMQP